MTTSFHSIALIKRKAMLTSSIVNTNRLLQKLLSDASIADSLFSELKIVPFTTNQVLYEFGDQIDYLYFPLDAVVSSLAIMEDGTTIETSMIGRESLVGISAILGR